MTALSQADITVLSAALEQHLAYLAGDGALGFVLIVAPLNATGQAQYSSNIHLPDAVGLLNDTANDLASRLAPAEPNRKPS